MTDQSAAEVLSEAGRASRKVSAEAMPPLCMFQPTPSMVLVGTAKPDDGADALVVLRIESVTGSTLVSLDPDSAIDIARKIHETAHKAKSGLVITTGPGILRPG